MSRRAVVVGGGVSGMAAALVLARNGREVRLVERSARLGSLLRGFVRDGVRYDTGLHYTGYWGDGEPLDTFLRYLGMDRDMVRLPFDPAGCDRVLCGDADLAFDLPCGRERVEEAYAAAFPAERAAIRDLLERVAAACAASPLLNPEVRFTPEQFLDSAWRQGLGEVMDELGLSPRLRTLLSIPCLRIGCEPADSLFADFARVAGSFHASAHAADGGGEALARAFEAALDREGVDVLLRAEAESLGLGADGVLREVRLADGRGLPADAVVYTGPPRALPAMLPQGALRPAYRKRLERLRDTPSAYMLFGQADQRLDLLDRRNVILLPRSNGERLFRRYAAGEDRPLFLSMDQSRERPGPRGVVALAAGDYSEVEAWADSSPGARPAAYREHKEAAARAIQAQVLAACPELAGKVRFTASATPLTFAHRLGAPRGGLYGALHGVGQDSPLPVTRAPGLFLAGQAIVAPGLLGAMVSAFLACGFVLGHETLRQGVAACRAAA
ncbi:MAG: FAD-dependent oxidoreductase [Thermodesulfobacteriota bacterium]